MSFVDWLDCPYCDGGIGVKWTGDHEHIVLECQFCGSMIKQYHGSFEQIPEENKYE